MPPKWTRSAKDGVGTALSSHSFVWFTISHGIVNEVYYPRIDIANTRDMQFLVTAENFFSEERKDTVHRTAFRSRGVPLYEVENTCREERYRIRKTIFTDPDADVLIQKVSFQALTGAQGDYSVYLLLAPHIQNAGYGNDAWIGEYKGIPMLFARRNGISIAACSNTGFRKMSCGYVGYSDPWQDIHANGSMTWDFNTARDGNVALGAEVIVPADGEFSVFTGFGMTPEEAALKAKYTMLKDMNAVAQKYENEWKGYFRECGIKNGRNASTLLYEISLSVLKVHQAKQKFPGALIASLSIPWGSSKGDDDMGGYHLVWTRDMVQTAMAQLAVGDIRGAEAALRFLMVTQEKDGRWPQNMWLDGSGYWKGIQLDEVAFPILLADKLRRMGDLDPGFVWPMVKKAAGFLLREGPSTQQDRWEEDGGLSPFTLAVEIGGLLSAADMAEVNKESAAAEILRKRADYYCEQLDYWTYVSGTDIADKNGVDGYYVRIAPPSRLQDPPGEEVDETILIKNRPDGQNAIKEENEVSVDAIALVRLGIRMPDDPRILNTLKVIDALLKTETETGPAWHRYNGDGYGEHGDGSPFDGTGIGRAWPLFSGERGHLEVSAGRLEEAIKLRQVMEQQTGNGILLPEQVWDAEDIPQRGLKNGKPAGSAMPLVWAHAEYLKLCRSIADKSIFDMPEATRTRYLEHQTGAELFDWTFNNKFTWIKHGLTLRISLFDPGRVVWTSDQWKSRNETDTNDSGLGIHYADIPTRDMVKGTSVEFTIYWLGEGKWEGCNFSVSVV